MTPTLQLDRRTLIRSLLLTSSAAMCGAPAFTQSALNKPIPAWREGELDLHHIDTGRGNCTFILAPDGTTIMIDSGASNAAEATSSRPRPDASRRAGEWQARYALGHSPANHLDYFIATHIHPDHIGDVSPQTPAAADAAYRLTGVSDVDRLMPIRTLIDRSYPDYGAAPAPDAPFAANYLAYLTSRVVSGRKVEAAHVGSDQQIQLKNPAACPEFRVRVLAADGVVWKAQEHTRPPLSSDARRNENIFSVALRIEYGRFSYFTGGDLGFDTHDGREPSLDIETPAVRACGRVEVAAADHHGYFDACGPAFVNTLDAQAYVIQAWDVGHPGSAQLQRMLGAWSDRPTHDVFATDLLPANELMNRRFAPMLKSRQGHVVVRVAKGGDTYRIFTVDSTRENGNVTGSFGPYTCRA